MSQEGPKDGATLRRRRLLDMITFVAQWPHDEKPCRDESINVFMLLKHGNRRSTVTQYLRELMAANVLLMDRKSGGYKLRTSYEATLAAFASSEDWGSIS